MAANKRFEAIGLVQASRCGYKQKLPLLFCFVSGGDLTGLRDQKAAQAARLGLKYSLPVQSSDCFMQPWWPHLDGIPAAFDAGAIRCSCVGC